MFGWFKKRTLNTMNNFVRTAQLTIGTALICYYGFDRAKSEAEKNDVAARASAAANFLNGQTPGLLHAHLDLPRIYADTRQWLRENATMRELVVQTLRVSHTVNHQVGRPDRVTEGMLLVLREFGDEFPAEPRMDSYKTLLSRAIATLPVENRQRLIAFMETGQ
jgi:hypothetical protein